MLIVPKTIKYLWAYLSKCARLVHSKQPNLTSEIKEELSNIYILLSFIYIYNICI